MIKKIKIFDIFKNFSKRERTIFYVAVVIVSISIVDRLIVGPVFSKIFALNDEIKKTELNIKNNLRILAQKDKILSESSQYNLFLASNKTDEEEIASFLKEIENIASKTSTYLIDLKPASSLQEGLITKYLVNINSEGQMEQIVDFMYQIENSNSLMTIERYQIAPKAKGSSIANANFVISKIKLK
ncbi:MAG: type 4a pilus biogenesis protein PilO [Candidatus Omnitrophica bacterium]|nr:type 4a pilus biogenesis protein PilO [Candidatus Omnitrophota bacterium]